ncbi:M23 family metallopeptidase [Nocardioides sambongensis]|uniref:M23 family metallopeptidase n=1 Tax=Nocardioides sambongensis TaxID=2589074 RepID=UPI001128A5C6|nr:M23 family metallopeptidase [Nocardioides sambongensis]
MIKVVVGLSLTGLLLGPAAVLIGIGVLLNPAAQATCPTPVGNVSIGPVPNQFTGRLADGTRVTLGRQQLRHAAIIIAIGSQTAGVGSDGITVALMAGLTESWLRMLANPTAYPESTRYPNDGSGADSDSLGIFQMRPTAGWGTVPELMDPTYQARAFYGGANGPNHGSPRGLLDIPGWRAMSKGAAAQAVEVSAYPDRYTNTMPLAVAILDRLTSTSPRATNLPPTSRVVFPLPQGTWHKTSTYGPRIDPITGDRSVHTGVDYAAPAGTPILAIADGTVLFAGAVSSGYAHLILIQHRIGGRQLVSGYAHMYADGIDVRKGQTITAGQRIGVVGADGKATGPHLHFEIRVGGPNGSTINPEPWLAHHDAAEGPPASSGDTAECAPDSPARPALPFPGGNPNRLVDDPTTGGRITARMAYVLGQARRQFPTSQWSCWRSDNPVSDHPHGRACDGTFGNPIGTRATGPALDLGWRVTNWLQTNARTLGVAYLIWQGKIWSVARADEGWRPYDGGGRYNPADVIGGHWDHLHVSV